MRRSISEIRRAIAFEKAEADESTTFFSPLIFGRTHPWPRAEMRTGGVIDALRWAAGDAGTEYERIMRARNREDVARMPRKGKPQL